MLTLYHSPQSRSTRIINLIDELEIWNAVDIRIVSITRWNGSGGHDPQNPHPEGKVPLLVHDGVEIWESNAIILYLTDLFPKAKLGPVVGEKDRGRYLSWLAWYGNVVEPVFVIGAAQVAHPIFDATFRGIPEMNARLAGALKTKKFLMGDAYSAADLLLSSPFVWFPEAVPNDPAIQAWLKRCAARSSAAKSAAFDAQQIGQTDAA